MPYRERLKMLSRHWVDYGFGAPKITMVIYIVKLLVFFIGVGILATTLTSDLDPFHPAAWWDEPIVYQKVVLWIVLLERLGLAGSWGPLAGKFKPMTGGCPLLRAARHAAQPAVAGQGPVHRGRHAHAGRRRALPRPGGEPRGRDRAAGRRRSDVTDAIGANKGLVESAPIISAIVFLVLARPARQDHASSPRAASSGCRR